MKKGGMNEDGDVYMSGKGELEGEMQESREPSFREKGSERD